MSTKIKKHAMPGSHATNRNPNISDDKQVKLSDRYIVVCPVFFENVISNQLDFINSIQLRQEAFTYKNQLEDIWTYYSKEFVAIVWQAEDQSEKLVYVKPQGRLFSCEDIMEVAALIEELKAKEALKIIAGAENKISNTNN